MHLRPIHMEVHNTNFALICSVLLFLTLVSQSLAATNLLGNETDYLSLQAFRDGITEDPLSALASWNHALHFCQWKGVACSSRHPQRVAILNLGNLGLKGSLSPSISNLTFLRRILLQRNNFHGGIPQQLGALRRLEEIDLGNNTLGGEIPANISNCLELRFIDFTGNMLVGEIPDLTALSKLETLYLSNNNLTGTIAPSLGNLSSLTDLSLMINSLGGQIPDELGRLERLESFRVAGNQLAGIIPPSLYNLSSMTYFSMTRNSINGSLPADLGRDTFPNLQVLLGGANLFTGPIPSSLSNASQLEQVEFTGNYLTGSLPMNLGRLQHLWYLGFAENELGSNTGNDLSIITALTNCSRLEVLSLANNQLGGVLPESVANLSSQLINLRLGVNNIIGDIPTGIENLVNLNFLGLQANFFTGSIPIGIGKLNMLDTLNMVANRLSGKIPTSLGNMTRLSRLYLVQNGLEGSVPVSLGGCKSLQALALQENNITGTIPKEILSFPSLFYLNLSHNYLTGSLPSEVGNLNNLGLLDVSENRLSGEIPSSLGICLTLEYLYMEGNFLQGSIPSSLSSLRGLGGLDLSRNALYGQIPKFLQEIPLQYLNLSFNNLEGEVPTHGIFRNSNMISVLGNKKLCGGIPILKLPMCPSQASKKEGRSPLLVIVSVTSVILSLVLFTCLFVICRWIRRSRTNLPPSTSSIEDQSLKVSYVDLLRATDGFSSANLVGEGSYGSVYRGILGGDGTIVAVKVLNLKQYGASESFMAECKARRNIRHRNLVKIITSCSSIDFKGHDFKALVYEYMPKGSLEMWLHPNEERKQVGRLTLSQRLNIAIDVAFALDYLHFQCQTPIIHRDLKPSNVLLDDDMNAHVSDFGLARFLFDEENNSSLVGSRTIGIKGSIGYVAPEYGMGAGASTLGDVYSYGILLLEMFTGKRPTDDMFQGGLSLHQFAKKALPEQVTEIVDQQLLLEENLKGTLHDCLASIIKIGVLCSTESARDRMDIGDAILEMQEIIDLYLGLKIHCDGQKIA